MEDQKTALADIVAGTGLNLRNKLKKQVSDLTQLSNDQFDEFISADLSQTSNGSRPSSSFVRNARRSFQNMPSQTSSRTPDSNDVDLDEQKRMMAYYENKKVEEERQRQREREANNEPLESSSAIDNNRIGEKEEETLVEVAPGMSLPLRSIQETYKSIVTGKTVSATCYGCQMKLYAVETVTMIICGDCWLCMPPERDADQEAAFEAQGPDVERSVGLGVTDDDIVKWFQQNQSA